MRRTLFTAIPPETKIVVGIRDQIMDYPACVICYRHAPIDAPYAWSNAHFIPRSQGGLGVERNLVTLCPDCHRNFDHGRHRAEYARKIQNYLMSKYADWSVDKLVYRKGV